MLLCGQVWTAIRSTCKSMLLCQPAPLARSFLEIYQNCSIFNDGAFEVFTEKQQESNGLFVEHGKPLLFDNTKEYGIKLDGFTPVM